LRLGSYTVAAKTGTTTDFRDNWTIGYSPDLIVGVWVGNADNTPMQEVSGVTGAGPIWNSFMYQILEELRPNNNPPLAFDIPDGVVQATVCATSGLLPTPYCPYTIQDWFIEGTVPTAYDNLYQPFEIDTRTGLLATEDTPAEDRREEVFLVLPPEAREWAAREGIPAPPEDAILVEGEDQKPLRLLSPDPYTIFQLTPVTPSETQRIQIKTAAPPNTVEVRFWFDDVLVTTDTEAPFNTWWQLVSGDHQVWAEATLDTGEILQSDPIPFRVHAWIPIDERPTSGDVE
jgi:membrane carboxypeptidase/penicillin-binding protein PbpC